MDINSQIGKTPVLVFDFDGGKKVAAIRCYVTAL